MAEEEYSDQPAGILYGQSKRKDSSTDKKLGVAKIPQSLSGSKSDFSAPIKREYGEKRIESKDNLKKAEILAGAAFVLALISLVLNIVDIGGSGKIRSELPAIIADLKALQAKDVILSSSPIRTTVQIEEEIPLDEVFPPNFRIPVLFNLKLPEKVTAISTTGQVTEFKFGQTLPIRQEIFVDTQNGSRYGIKIKKEIPVNINVQATVKIKEMYGSELDDIIDRLERVS